MKRIQFSLATLLIMPLALSPLLIALRECRNIATGDKRELGPATVLLGFLYVAAFTLIDCRRRLATRGTQLATHNTQPAKQPRSPSQTRRAARRHSVLWCWLQAALQGMLRGSLYSMLYYLLIFLPLAAADQYYTFWRLPWYERILEFSRSACWGVGIGVFTGLPIGGALGVLVEVVWGGRRREDMEELRDG